MTVTSPCRCTGAKWGWFRKVRLRSSLMHPKMRFFCLWLLAAFLWIAGAAWILRDELRADCLGMRLINKPASELTDLELACTASAALPTSLLERGLLTVRAKTA